MLKRLCCPSDIEALMLQVLDSPLGQLCLVKRAGGCELAWGQFHLRHMCGDEAYTL